MSELRWNPVLEEWTITATHRQERTFLPPKDYCPLCPSREGRETEVPAANYEIVCFENKFPSLKSCPPPPAVEGDDLCPVMEARGICEVVLYTPQHDVNLADQPVEQIYRLIQVWTDRYRELGSYQYINYVFIFENKGEVIGVTLTHPHGQIYAFPFIPPRVEKELNSGRKYWRRHGSCLFCALKEKEIREEKRIVFASDYFVAFVPFYARWPYEVHLYSREHRLCLTDFGSQEQYDLAVLLKIILQKYDHLFNFSFPYMMIMHQKPTDGKSYPYYHFHIEFYPPYRSRDKIKFLAGSESGAGAFINDTLAEEKAAELRAAFPHHKWEVEG